MRLKLCLSCYSLSKETSIRCPRCQNLKLVVVFIAICGEEGKSGMERADRANFIKENCL